MADGEETATGRVRSAAARTSSAGSARLAFGLGAGSPVLAERDWVGEGVVDFAARRAQVSQLFMPERMQEDMLQRAGEDASSESTQKLRELLAPRREMLFDGANQFLRAGDRWIALTRDDRDGPRHHDDPLWPLDALFGASGDVTELDEQPVRDSRTVHCRLTVDLASADAFVPAGVTVPEGPYSQLRRLLTEVWLDAAGLARRIAVAKTWNAAGEQRWMVLEFWDFGVPVTISPPDPDRITALDNADPMQILMPGNPALSPDNDA